jgi:hypothetical protein
MVGIDYYFRFLLNLNLKFDFRLESERQGTGDRRVLWSNQLGVPLLIISHLLYKL